MTLTTRIAAIVSAVALLTLVLVFTLRGAGGETDGTEAFDAPGLEAMTIEEARGEFFRLTPALLLVVYDAFGRSEEAQIYDTLAQVAGADALEALYLERVGAMAGGGLDEADQTIHEIKLLTSTVSGGDETLVVDASWQVIGTVGHAEHLHVRGNTYSADLTITPLDGAWKITDFHLRDVDRETAGEVFSAPPTNG